MSPGLWMQRATILVTPLSGVMSHKVRSAANKAIQLQGAIDQSNTPTMMIDRDFLITYGNKATFALLKENEEVFAKAFPGF